jgi:TPR repeat protein
MYENGSGVTQSDAEAVYWYRLAADQGNAFAQVKIGSMYAAGRGVAKDDAEAIRWYTLAAKQGNADAEDYLIDLGENP